MIKVYTYGSFQPTEDFLRRMQSRSYLTILEKYAIEGVSALRAATPEKSGLTADSWGYEIINRPGYFSIKWTNINVEEPGHTPVAVLLQYGHGVRGGRFISGVDYINPAMRPIFEEIANSMWKEVTR